MATGVDELISSLYEMVQDAWGLPLGADKCVIERDKILDVLDEISNQLPGEFKQAKTITDSRNEIITNARKDAENIRRQAEERARQLISRDEVYLEAVRQSNELLRNTEAQNKELRSATIEFVDDALRRCEDSIAQALSAIRQTRQQFQSVINPKSTKDSPIIEDI